MRQIPGRTYGLELSKDDYRCLRGELASKEPTSECVLFKTVQVHLYTRSRTRP